jgi:hypothetical protein
VIEQAKKGKVSHKQVKQIVAKRKLAPRGKSMQPAKRQLKTSAKPQDPNKWTRTGTWPDGKGIYVRNNEAEESADERKLQCATGEADKEAAIETHVDLMEFLEEECERCDTDEQRWRNSVASHASNAIAMRSLWKRLFGD